MTTMTTSSSPTSTETSTPVRTGLALGALVGAINFAFIFYTGDWGPEEPPFFLVLVQGLIGLVSVAAAVLAWRTANRKIIRINAAALIVNALGVVPGVFMDGPAFIRLASSLLILGTVPAVILMMRRGRMPAALAA
jgi:hypothetical protein